MLNWWKDLSVSIKLYAVVGLMAVLIAAELFTLLFAMSTLSSVRAFVEGEGLWSKAQKNAIYSLHQYAVTRESNHYDDFKTYLKVNQGDRRARLELMKPQPDLNVVREGFIQGGVHPNDIDGIVRLIRKFHWVHYINEAIKAWTAADSLLDEQIALAGRLRAHIEDGNQSASDLQAILERFDTMNDELTVLENKFSSVLGAGSRWLEHLLMVILVCTVLTIESTGLFLTFMFSRNLNRSLTELSTTVSEVGKGNFSVTAPVRSRDELGQLAGAINKMASDLKTSIGQRQQAESASQIKSMFLANMSHEIRTPLGVILGMIDILKDPEISAGERNYYLQVIERTGLSLTAIINDVLDISKVEAGHLMIEKAPFPLEEFMDELFQLLNFRAEKTQNKLVFEPQGELPEMMVSDRLRLRQILLNLISNALKFTERGTVRVRYGVVGHELIFRVSDSGIGIPRERQNELFQLFSQIDPSSTRKYEGTGLGLALSKRLAMALGGDVILESSETGKGSTFLVRMPNEGQSHVADGTGLTAISVPASAGDFKGKRILLVDDSPDNQTLIRILLARKGADVDSAMNGADGMKKALEGRFDLVLMDMQMPIMDGYEATKKLRSTGFAKPIVALTAHAMKEDRDRCLGAGCNDYLTKPIETAGFYRVLSKYMEPSV